MEASRINPAAAAARADELQRENERLREQLRGMTVQQTAIRNAALEANGEREATERLAHQVVVEERATRTAVEVHGNTIGFAAIMQILNFFLLLIVAFGLFVYVPREMDRRLAPPSNTVVTPGSSVVIPGR